MLYLLEVLLSSLVASVPSPVALLATLQSSNNSVGSTKEPKSEVETEGCSKPIVCSGFGSVLVEFTVTELELLEGDGC